MTITLNENNFINGRFIVAYGVNKEALFTIVDEEFPGLNQLGRVNKITILVREITETEGVINASLQSSVIGLGNRIVGVMSENASLRGQVLNRDNMSQCTVILYE